MGMEALQWRQIYEELERVQTQSEIFKTQLRQNLDPGGDEADKANDLVERARAMALHWHLLQQRRQLARAQERFAQGLADVCEECGQPIDPARLKALAGVTRCLRCQRHVERRNRSP